MVRLPRSYNKANLPSYKDGISPEEENMLRSRTCRFIEEAGKILKLPRLAQATAMVLFHRFFAKHSFAQHDRFEVAISCILLAAKVEEAPKKLSTIILECHALKSGAATASRPTPRLDTNSEDYVQLKERILLLERVVLHTIAFELSIDHPFPMVLDKVRKLCNLPRKVEYEKHSEGALALAGAASTAVTNKMTNDLVQYAMAYANDSMYTCLCLQYTAKQIALGCVFMAAKYCSIQPTNQDKGWIDLLDGMPVEILVSICEQIMDVISKRQGPNGTTAGNKETVTKFFATLQREFEVLKKQNFLMSGPTADGIAKKRLIGDADTPSTNSVKRPR